MPVKENQRPRGAARREALLEAVLAIVGEVGADAVTHRRVAERAGLPLASTTYWFASKEELLTAALELAAQRDVARLHRLAAELRDTERDPVQSVLDTVLDPLHEASHRASLLASYALLLEAARRPALQALSRRWTAAYLDTVGELLRRAGSGRPREHARLVMAAADGLMLEQLNGGDEGDPRPALHHLVDSLIGTSS